MPEEETRAEKPESKAEPPASPPAPEPAQPAAKSEPLAPIPSEPQPPGESILSQAHGAETSQEPAEAAQRFPSPFEQDIEYEIVEPPEGEESDDGFASIPPGPTEEVRFEPERAPGPRRRRGAPRREPAPARAEEAQRRRFPVWQAVAAAVLAALILAALILLIARNRGR